MFGVIGGRFDTFKLTDFQKKKGFITDIVKTLDIDRNTHIISALFARGLLYLRLDGGTTGSLYGTYSFNPNTGIITKLEAYMEQSNKHVYTNENDRMQYLTYDYDNILRRFDLDTFTNSRGSSTDYNTGISTTIYFNNRFYFYIFSAGDNTLTLISCDANNFATSAWTTQRIKINNPRNANASYIFVYNNSIHILFDDIPYKRYYLQRIDILTGTSTLISTIADGYEYGSTSNPSYQYIVKNDIVYFFSFSRVLNKLDLKNNVVLFSSNYSHAGYCCRGDNDLYSLSLDPLVVYQSIIL
jgi:hypothetical protein